MTPLLSTHEIARLVGSQVFSRGERYARNGNVVDMVWPESGTQLLGRVAGSTDAPYSVTISFAVSMSGVVMNVSGVCSCPVGRNCKHVAALLIAGRRPEVKDLDSDGGLTGSAARRGVSFPALVPDVDGGGDAASVSGRPSISTATKTGANSRGGAASAPAIPAWQRQLAPLAQQARTAVAAPSIPLALQFEVLEATRSSRMTPGPSTYRLGIRPMVMGKKGAWIRGNLNWTNLSYARGTYNPEHQKILGALYALYSAGQSYYVHIDQWMHLDGFASRALWELLDDARLSGLPLISTAADQAPITLLTEPATVALDLTRRTGGLELTPALSLARPDDVATVSGAARATASADLDTAASDAADGGASDTATVPEAMSFGFIGEPAHGVFAWQLPDIQQSAKRAAARPSRGSARRSASVPTTGPATGARITLAPLATKLDTPLRRLLSAPANVVVPSHDEPAFLADYYPFLRRQLELTSSDGSFELPATARPYLSVELLHTKDAGISLRWSWQYATPNVEGAVDAEGAALATAPADAGPRLRLRAPETDANYRDPAHEAEILRELTPLLASFDTLFEQHGGRPRLAERSTLTGARMIEFLSVTTTELSASGQVFVQLPEDGPQYREADEAPVISLATTERPDDRDWFDLAVTVSIEGEEIPFDDLFRALATEQELLILGSGTWFSLDRPEFTQLRRLIEEARGLQDSHSSSLGISRFQTDLWVELQELGLVAAQASAWRQAVEGLTDATQVAAQKLPESVNASLREYQQSGFDWLSFLYDNQLGGILADDMGLGKTLQAISLIAHARDRQRELGTAPAPFLVVAPTSVVSNWAAECAKFAPSLRVVTVFETSAKRGSALATSAADADVVITSYTLFRLDFEEYNAINWAGLLLDEAQFVKNHQSRAHLCARRLKAPFKLAITGTPLENNLMEFWSLTSITAPGLFPSPSRFSEYYQKPIERDADSERLAQLRRRIRPFMLRRTKDQVAKDLPAKQEQVLELELHPKHRKVYQMHLQRERQKVLGLIEDMNANRFEIFRSLTMLRQLSLDASLYDEKYSDVPSTKLDALMELLEDVVAEGHRTLIFSQFTQYLGKARDRLDAAGISYSYLDGKTRNRAKAIADFKEGTTSVFLISLKAGGFGLNLTEADYCILLDPWWNPATEAQAVDRAHRIGQTKNVMVYRLVSKDTIEEKVMALKATKAQLFESVMTDGAVSGTGLSAADIRELLS
jgi:superfamily II DNA or RNA helicase